MNIIKLKSINSTNLYAKEIAKKYNEDTIIISKEQTNGYGTKGKTWFSDKDSIICSFLLFPKGLKKTNENLSYEIGVMVSNALNNLLDINTYVKKPNDIYLDNKKICGILIETEYCKNTLKYLIVGIGINVNQENFPNEISNIATSIYLSSGKKHDKKSIVNMLIKSFEKNKL